MSVVNGTLERFRGGRQGFYGDDVGGVGDAQLDSQATPSFPTSLATEGVWFGTGTRAEALACNVGTNVVIGNAAQLSGVLTDGLQTCVGANTESSGPGATAVGAGARANASGLAVGQNSTAQGGLFPTSVGTASRAGATGAVALGNGAIADHISATAIGQNAQTAKTLDVCLGANAVAIVGGPSFNLRVQAPDVVVAAAGASDVYLSVRINNVLYKLLLHT